MCGQFALRILLSKQYLIRNVRKRTFWRALNKDLNQPAHPRSLIRVFAVRLKKHCARAIQNAPSEDSDQTARIWIFAGRSCPKVRYLTFRLI